MSDTQRVLRFFRQSNGKLISSMELIEGKFDWGKRIIEYTGRISNAREILGCSCGKDQKTCSASEHIKNVKTNWYQYQSTKTKTSEADTPTLVNDQINYRELLEQTRDRYRKETDSFKRELLKAKGMILRDLAEDQELYKSAQEALL